jgi:hypothetical protein
MGLTRTGGIGITDGHLYCPDGNCSPFSADEHDSTVSRVHGMARTVGPRIQELREPLRIRLLLCVRTSRSVSIRKGIGE